MTNLIEVFEQSQMAKNLPEIKVGDTVKVYHKIQEGDKFRVQTFQGIVIAKKGERSRLRIVVRKISVGGIGVEKTFFLYHPLVVKIEILKRAKVRRAKLYYLRDAKGKKALKLKERMPEVSEVLMWEEGEEVKKVQEENLESKEQLLEEAETNIEEENNQDQAPQNIEEAGGSQEKNTNKKEETNSEAPTDNSSEENKTT